MPVTQIKDLKEENDDDERQKYYAGGQGKGGGGSGQEVLDPRDFMKRAREEMGGQTVGEWKDGQEPPPSSAFTGSGNTLSGASVEGAAAPPPPAKNHVITFYQNGFTVDDGPLRGLTDPESAAFLQDVNQGRMPAELRTPEDEGADVNIIDKSQEPYKPPPVTLKPFSGEGRSMRDEAGPSAASSAEAAELTLDPGAPTTTLQVRLADGSRKVIKANHTHTVLQLRSHIATLTAPGAAFALKGGFPPKPLTDDAKTLADAGLLNETIVQSMA